MVQLVDQAMTEGAIGLSSGLEYEVGSYSATDEVVAMSAVAAKHGGFYMTHIRDEADKAFDALNEEIANRRARPHSYPALPHQARHGRRLGKSAAIYSGD